MIEVIFASSGTDYTDARRELSNQLGIVYAQRKGRFYRQLPVYNPKYIRVSANQFTVFADEQISLEIEPAFVFHPNDVEIMRGGMAVDFSCDNGLIKVNETPVEPGEYCYQICVKVSRPTVIFSTAYHDGIDKGKMLLFGRKQQYHNSLSRLDGAYLIYDTEEGHIYYESKMIIMAGESVSVWVF